MTRPNGITEEAWEEAGKISLAAVELHTNAEINGLQLDIARAILSAEERGAARTTDEIHELQASVSALESERQSIIATKREQLSRQAAEIERLNKRIVRLEEALSRSMTAIDDWLHVYAGEFCHEDRVKEAQDRVYEYGTIGYIAHVQQQNRAALSSPQGD